MNFLAAAAAAHRLGVAPEAIAGGGPHLTRGPHRGEVRRLGAGRDAPRRLLQLDPDGRRGRGRRARPRPARGGASPFLGDMLELGTDGGPELHRERGRSAAPGELDVVVGVGPLGRELAGGRARRGTAADGALRDFADAARRPRAAASLVRARRRRAREGLARHAHGAVVEALVARFGEAEG